MPKIAAFGEACDNNTMQVANAAIAARHDGDLVRMTEEFVQTGQTLTGTGDAYCPLERKRRGPAAVAAALSVLVLGRISRDFRHVDAQTRNRNTDQRRPRPGNGV